MAPAVSCTKWGFTHRRRSRAADRCFLLAVKTTRGCSTVMADGRAGGRHASATASYEVRRGTSHRGMGAGPPCGPANPLGEVVRHPRPVQPVGGRYDKMRRIPDGLWSPATAICSFKPDLLGPPGMTWAALESAGVAGNACPRHKRTGRGDFPKAAGTPIRAGVANCPDRGGHCPTRNGRGAQHRGPRRLSNGYVGNRVLTAAEFRRPPHSISFARVDLMVTPRPRLLAPAMMWRATGPKLHGRQRRQPNRRASPFG